ncbi:MAG: ArsA-related P-loop ATPase [Acidimicrobiia bacterium]|nr:ArsA-related P-loop ATPase [Acidimicrobiia bacterium]
MCTGSGGVGKTTIAAVLALEAARHGRRAVVVTIDPAKRLADALGLQTLTNEPRRIDGDWSGELWAHDARHRSPRSTTLGGQSTPTIPEQARGASSPTASTATSPAPSRAPRSTWRWRSSTTCTSGPSSTSWWSTHPRPATPSTSSTRPGRSPGSSTTASTESSWRPHVAW